MPRDILTAKPVIVVIFTAMAAAIVAIAVVGHAHYKKDMYLATKPVVISRQNVALGPVHAAKFPGNEVAQRQQDERAARISGQPVAAATDEPHPSGKPSKPTDDDMRCRIQLPAGFDSPVYETVAQQKENYVMHAFDVISPSGPRQQPTSRLYVAEIDRKPLDFPAYSRSLRLGALHDFRNGRILEEGPTTVNGAAAYTLVVEGEVEGRHVKSREIAIQGEGTIMYEIKGTAPVEAWPAAGEEFDASILSFRVAPPTASTKTAPTTAATATATAPAKSPGTAPGGATTWK